MMSSTLYEGHPIMTNLYCSADILLPLTTSMNIITVTRREIQRE